MQYSEVLVKILQRASEVQGDAKVQYVSAPVILVAVAELCGKKYQGITNYVNEQYPVWYEEERLRYLFKKMFRASGNLVSFSVMRRLQKEYLEYDVDFLEVYKGQLEAQMKERGLSVLTSDIVFLVALNSFADRQRMGLHPKYQEQIFVKELLAEVDGCIYDYVISEIKQIQAQLQKKIDEAKEKRDWKPAEKIMEPEEMLERFFAAVQVKKDERSLELVFPYFYDGKRELRLTIIYIDGIYYVKDGQGVTGYFCQIFTFMKYLQRLILLEESEKTGYIPEADEVEVDWSKAEVFDVEALLEELKECVVARYDEKRGITLGIVHMCYDNYNTSVSFLFEPTEVDEWIRIKDAEEGFEKDEYLETFSMTDKITDGNYVPLLFAFFCHVVKIMSCRDR